MSKMHICSLGRFDNVSRLFVSPAVLRLGLSASDPGPKFKLAIGTTDRLSNVYLRTGVRSSHAGISCSHSNTIGAMFRRIRPESRPGEHGAFTQWCGPNNALENPRPVTSHHVLSDTKDEAGRFSKAFREFSPPRLGRSRVRARESDDKGFARHRFDWASPEPSPCVLDPGTPTDRSNI
jgi:hypothetical protein